MKPLSFPQLLFLPHYLMVPWVIFSSPPTIPNPPIAGQFFICRNNDEKYKAFLLFVSFDRAAKGQGYGQGLLMSCPGQLKRTVLGN